MTENFKRKLTAILSADVVGYSRLMGEDEASTVKTLETYKGVMSSLIKQHRGRVVDSPGDNLLAEFGSVVDAVQCAVSIQKELQTRNADLPDSRKMEFRIGINLGDVIEEEDRIYGDGVNIAARLESLADPGGICISKTAFDHIENKLPLGYEFLGEQTVKNITKPVGAYRVLMEPRVTSVKEVKKKKAIPLWKRKSALSIGVIVILGIAAVLYWNLYLRGPSIEPASVTQMAHPLPDKTSIAVLPFKNETGDPEQDYIGDGLSRSICNALSVSSQMFVIDRNATFRYKETPVKPQQVAEDLGVQYILDGSIQKSGDRLRVTAQLIDALAGNYLWSDNYDREIKDLLELQDEITKKIMVSLQVELTPFGDDTRVLAKSTDNLEAWKYFVRGIETYFNFIEEDNVKARQHLETALKLDPGYVSATSLLGCIYLEDFIMGWSDSPSASFNRAYELAQKAVELDEQDPFAHGLLSYISVYQEKYEKAITEGKRSITLNPNFSLGYAVLGTIMAYCGQFDESIDMITKGYRRNPNLHPVFLRNSAGSYIFLKRYEEALEVCNEMEEQALNGRLGGFKFIPPLYISWVYQELGREEEARAYMTEALKRYPDYSLDLQKKRPYRNPAHLKRVMDAFRKAGMPEHSPGAVQEKPSIAVLPFDDMSPDKDQEYFADGLSDEILNRLAQIKDLTVIARTSSFSFKGKNKTIQEIARVLNVDHILEGSVRKAGDSIRITAQLIKTADESHLWSDTYHGELKDIFTVQDDIAKAVTTALSITLGAGQFNRPGMTHNVEAYDIFLRAMGNINKSTPDSMLAAIDQLKRALDIDPDFGVAWTRLSGAYGYSRYILSPEQTRDFEVWMAEARKRAQAVAPNMPQLIMNRAREHERNGNWLETERIWKQELEETGHYNGPVNGLYGDMLMKVGRISDALPYLQRAKRLTPMFSTRPSRLPGALLILKRNDEALEEFRHAQTLEGFNAIPFIDLIEALEANERTRAAAIINTHYDEKGDYYDATMLRLAELLLIEDTEKALFEMKEISKGSDISTFTRASIAHIASALGDEELAFKNIRGLSDGLALRIIWFPIYNTTRKLPAFKAWIREIGLYDYWRTTGEWGDFCRPVGDDDFECD